MKSILNALENSGISQAAIGESVEIRYLAGYPLQYRFNASAGLINIGGEKPVTQKGAPFTFRPCAYRLFKDKILNFNYKRWAEFFFINETNAICNLLIHGYSVENLMLSVQSMYYDNLNLCSVALTLKPIERTNKATGNKYFIAEFGYKPLPREEVEKVQEVIREIPIWREDTLTGDAVVELSENYSPPTSERPSQNKQAA